MTSAVYTFTNIQTLRPTEIIPVKNSLGVIAGKKVYITTNPIAAWISRLVCTLIVAAGIALIAALTTPIAIVCGISLIGFGVVLCGLLELYRAGRVLAYEKMSKERSHQNLGCQSDFSNLPEVEYLSDRHDVTIKLTRNQIEMYPFHASRIGFLPKECENKVKHPFLLVLKPQENQLSASVMVYDSQFKNKVFTIDLEGRLLLLNENPMTVAKIENNLKKTR